MDALMILGQMHVEAKAAFQKIQTASPSDRGALWAKLQPQLELHEQIEEEYVYDPVAREVGQKDPILERWEREHEAQVREADTLMGNISALDPKAAGWLRGIISLAHTLDRHIEHEEDDIWPRIRAVWGEEKLAHAGRRIGAAKTAAEGGASTKEAIAGARGASN